MTEIWVNLTPLVVNFDWPPARRRPGTKLGPNGWWLHKGRMIYSNKWLNLGSLWPYLKALSHRPGGEFFFPTAAADPQHELTCTQPIRATWHEHEWLASSEQDCACARTCHSIAAARTHARCTHTWTLFINLRAKQWRPPSHIVLCSHSESEALLTNPEQSRWPEASQHHSRNQRQAPPPSKQLYFDSFLKISRYSNKLLTIFIVICKETYSIVLRPSRPSN